MRVKTIVDGVSETTLVPSGTSVGEVLEMLGLSFSENEVLVNGEQVSSDTELEEGDEISIEKKKHKSGTI